MGRPEISWNETLHSTSHRLSRRWYCIMKRCAARNRRARLCSLAVMYRVLHLFYLIDHGLYDGADSTAIARKVKGHVMPFHVISFRIIALHGALRYRGL